MVLLNIKLWNSYLKQNTKVVSGLFLCNNSLCSGATGLISPSALSAATTASTAERLFSIMKVQEGFH